MNSREDSWRTVAFKLAARLKNFDYCDNGHTDWREGITDGCPCCHDRAAYAAFAAKAYGTHVPEDYNGPTVNLRDIR